MKYLHFISLLLVSLFLFPSCEENNDINMANNIPLYFSVDSIFYDTLLSGIPSPFQRIRVVNPHKYGVLLSEVSLTGLNKNSVDLWYKGEVSESFPDILLAGEDSALFLIQISLENGDEDNITSLDVGIRFLWSDQQKIIPIEVYKQNVTFFSHTVWCDTILTSNRPIVILDTVLVDSACNLTIKPGTNIYFAPGAALFIGGTLHVEGDSSDWVIFSNNRKDSNYKIAPGQWRGIFFLTSSRENRIHFTLIENAEIGLYVGIPDDDSLVDLTIENSIVRHHSVSAIQSFNSDLSISNSLFYDAGRHLLFHAIGGSYTYNHCSIINRPSSFLTTMETIVFADNLIQDASTLSGPLKVSMKSCVVWGPGNEGLLLSEILAEKNSLHFFENLFWGSLNLPSNYWVSKIDEKLFFDENNYNYMPDSLSFLIDKAVESNQRIDLFGRLRENTPDLGAIEYVKNP